MKKKKVIKAIKKGMKIYYKHGLTNTANKVHTEILRRLNLTK